MKNMEFIKGVGIGLAVGSALSMTIIPRKKSCKHAFGRAVKNCGEVIENVCDAMGI